MLDDVGEKKVDILDGLEYLLGENRRHVLIVALGIGNGQLPRFQERGPDSRSRGRHERRRDQDDMHKETAVRHVWSS